jgi:4-amino-4-deoxy-L-arabinose transferase-like glycosyltransferase
MNRHVLILLLLSFISFFLNLGGPSIYILDEAKNAGCAMEMQQRNDWIVPTFNNELRSDKPPLHYYFMRCAYSAFGVTPFAARFFSAIMGLLLVSCVYRFVKKFINPLAAFYAGIILLCSIQASIQFRLAVPDPYLITFLTASLLLFYEGFLSGKTGPLMFSYGCVAMAALAKGPVAILFYGLIVLFFLLATRSFSWKQLLRLKVPVGILIFLAMVLPWYVLVGIATDGEWLQQFFFKHNVGRFTATMEGHKGFPLASLLILILALMPFSFYFPQMLKAVWSVRQQNTLLLLCLIAITVVVIFFAFSRTLLPGYIAPAFPFFAILLGYYWQIFIAQSTVNTGSRISGYCMVILSAALCVGLWRAETELAGIGVSYIWPFGLVLVAGSVSALLCLYRQWLSGAFISYAASWVIFIALFFGILFPAIDARNPVTKSLPLLTNAKLACFQTMNPAFVFALKTPVREITSVNELQRFLGDPDARVITNIRALKKTDSVEYSILFQQKDLFERSATVIIAGKR